MQRLGEILRARNLITSQQLDNAIALQKRSGGRLGDILIAEGAIGYFALYRTIADQYNIPFANLLEHPPEPALLAALPPEIYLKKLLMPWQRDAAGILTIALTDYDDGTIHWCKQKFGKPIKFALTSPFDIRRAVSVQFGAQLESTSRNVLWENAPLRSARVTIPEAMRPQLKTAAFTLFALTLFAPLAMALAFIVFCHLAYAATMIFKCIVFGYGTQPVAAIDWKKKLATLEDRALPVYTVLIPMYREPESLPGIIAAMQAMDYPAAKLDIKFVLEADDDYTYNAACALRPQHHFDIIRVPPGNPRTKPKACNYALRFARGEFVTVFDADDQPEPLQLKKAVYTFRNSPRDVACLQARLNYYNAHDNWLTRFFSLEYTILFQYMLYGLERMKIPLPLGGTSNHMALARLRELGEWDPYNVTEDADLGTRISAHGFKTRMLDSYTMEEAPRALAPWINQRSRWIKGYMQTWLVHMRSPRELYKTLGLRGFMGFQFFVGFSCFTFLSAPLVWVVSLLWVGAMVEQHHFHFPIWLMWLTGINFILNMVTHWYLAIYSIGSYRGYTLRIISLGLFYPFYMVLHTIASYKALWQLIVKPHFWEKTMHGLTSRRNISKREADIVKTRAAA